jgi:dolichyl-phosphate beta-glucosyltransferase
MLAVRSKRCCMSSSSSDKQSPFSAAGLRQIVETSYYNWQLPRLSIIIPAYNEERRLPESLRIILKWLDNSEWADSEVIVVDDGSTDKTTNVVREFTKKDPRVRLLCNPGNHGKGYSVRNGMHEGKGDWLLFSDADLSAPIEELPKLFEAVRREDAQIAIGSRALDRGLIGTHQSVFREYAGRFFNLMVKLITGLPFWDTQCGFKLFRKDAARTIFRRVSLRRFGFDVEVLFVGKLYGFKTVEVPVRWNHVEGTKVSMFRDSADMFLDLLRIRWRKISGWYQ